jgi:hypothetical protein
MSAPRRPKPPRRGTGHAEGVNESPALIEAERVDAQKATPAEQRSSVERPSEPPRGPAVFEE